MSTLYMSIAAALCLVCFSGCKAYEARNYLDRHVIALNGAGQLDQFSIAQPDPTSSSGIAVVPTLPRETGSLIDQVLDAAEAEARQRLGDGATVPLLIHVHGGLNSPEASRGHADRIVTIMGDEDPSDWMYPVFVQWNSGPLSTALDATLHLRQGRHLGLTGVITAPIMFTVGLARGVVRAPRSLLYQWYRDGMVASAVVGGPSFQTWKDSERIEAAATQDLSGGAVPDAVFDVRSSSYSRSRLQHAWRLVRYFPMQVFKIPAQVVFLEGLGQGAWDEMRRRVQGLVWKADTFEADRVVMTGADLEESIGLARPTGAFVELFDKIHERESRPDGPVYRVQLVGHSMGAMALNRVLPWIETDSVEKVIYMAPACTVADAVDAIVPFLDRNKCAHFYLLALNPIAEADEIPWYDTMPRGSLLEWIDNYYTTPASHVERVFGKWSNALPAITMFYPVRERVHFKSFDVDGGSLPQVHGDFNKIPFWRAEAHEVKGGKGKYPKGWFKKRCVECLESQALPW